MNLPKIEPIVWKKQKPEVKAEVIPVQVQYMTLPPRDDVRHDYIAADGIIYTHWPELPELSNNNKY